VEATAQIFLSYAREDGEKVEGLYQKLSAAGLKPWMDKKDILPGEKWALAIQKAIRCSDFFLVCLSANSVRKRGWVQREMKQALDLWQEKLEDDIYLIPVRLEDCEAPESLRDFQWVNLFEEDGWERLVKAIQIGMERRAEEIKPVLEKPSPGMEMATPEEGPEQVPLTEDDLPFNLEKIPRAESFVRRAEEIAAYRSQLEENNLAIIEGMAGVGKTALGAELAWQFQEAGWRVFWLTLIRGVTDNVEELVTRLAGFVAVVGGDDRLWKMLQAESTDGQHFDLSRKFELFLKSAEEGQYLLCLDDFHLVAEDERFQPLFQLLMQRFGGQREDYPMKLIIIGRQVADYMSYLQAEYGELQGLSFEDAKAFLGHHQVQLDDDQLEIFYQRIGGNTQMLSLSVGRLQDIQGDREKVEQFIANLQHQNQIQALMEDISRSLSSEEQLILSALSLFRGAAVSRPELEAVLVDEEEVEGLRDGLRNLIKWHVSRQTEDGRVSLYGLVKEYAYDELDATPRRRMHARAGRYFEGEKDYIEAAYHYDEAGQFDAAAAALADRTRLLINQGHREVLLAQLEELRERQKELNSGNWIAVVEGLGDVYRARSDYEAAIEQFEESIRLREKGGDPSGLARAYNKLGDVYLLQGDFPKVAEASQIALERARVAEDKAEEARAHLLLGIAYYEQGNAERAAAAHQQSLAMGRALSDDSLIARSYMELAIDYEGFNRYKEAVESHRNSLRLFLEMGDTFRAASAYSNLGGIYHDQWLFDEALHYYEKGLTLAIENGDEYRIALLKGNMGEVYYMLGDHLQAERHLEEAIAICRNIGQINYLATFTADLGGVKLALGDPESALELGMRSLELARETGNKPREGVARRVLGEVYARMGDQVQAEEHLRAAVEILETVDYSPIEGAKAKQSYGQFLLQAGEQEKGAAYLQQALTAFGAIEADREQAEADGSLE